MIKKRIRKKEKEFLDRSKLQNYTEIERSIIKNICTDDVFKTYFFFCPNNNIWKNLANKLGENEIITHIIVTNLHNLFFDSGLVIMPVSSSGNIFCYKANRLNILKAKAKFKFQKNISQIKNIQYKPSHEIADIYKYGIPARLYIKLNNNSKIYMWPVYSFEAEFINRLYIRSNNPGISEEDIEENARKVLTSKLQELLDKKIISKHKHEKLLKRLHFTPSKYRRKLLEECEANRIFI